MRLLLFLFSVFLFTSCQSNYADLKAISMQEFKKTMEASNNLQLLDVRTPKEFKQGHIKGAINVNVFSENFVEEVQNSLNNKEALYIYCKSGKRSLKAARILTDRGFENVFTISEGYNTWKNLE